MANQSIAKHARADSGLRGAHPSPRLKQCVSFAAPGGDDHDAVAAPRERYREAADHIAQPARLAPRACTAAGCN
jgi:hypothetical protein